MNVGKEFDAVKVSAWENVPWSVDKPQLSSEAGQSSWLSRLVVIWLAGITVLLPVKTLNLPMNFELVDIWIIAGMPIALYAYIIRRPHVLSLHFVIPMWFVLVSSFISAVTSSSPMMSTVVIMKEIYLFAWFFVVMALLFQMSEKNLRIVLQVWTVVVLGHGLLMVAQFLSPDVWQFTNTLGGNTARYDAYRAVGLFICDKAGCANKAAVFQLLGFVPLLLAGFSTRKTLLLGIFLLTSMMTSGSMGATIAFCAGCAVALLAVAYLKKSLSLLFKVFIKAVPVLFFTGVILYIVGSQQPKIVNHFESIILGRYEKSSGGRFDLWGRGIDVLLEHNVFLWGVGPENFRVVDAAQTDNQLHNDTLAFLVERGLLGLIGLGLFAVITLVKSFQIIQLYGKNRWIGQLGTVVFLAMLAAMVVESLTHQVFHTRELWLVMAVQEAVLYKMRNPEIEIKEETEAGRIAEEESTVLPLIQLGAIDAKRT